MALIKVIVNVCSTIFVGMCGGYLSYFLITLVYEKFWRSDVPWFNWEDFVKFSNGIWFKIWWVGAAILILSWFL